MRRSKEEDIFESDLNLLFKSGDILGFEYEPVSIIIGVARTYTPDYVVEYRDRYEVIECKGYPKILFRRQRNHVAEGIRREAGKTKFMVAALINPVKNKNKPVFWRLIELVNNSWKTVYLVRNGKKISKKKVFPLHAEEVNGK